MFEVGQKVVCVKTHPEGVVKEGEVYTLIGLKKSCCLTLEANVGIKSPHLKHGDKCLCYHCLTPDVSDGFWWFDAERFRPLDDLFNEEIEELMNEIEELCPA